MLEKAGLEENRFHDLRHTVASIWLNNGIPLLVVLKLLGHANASTALDIFGHLISVKQEEAASTMDELTTPIAVQMNQIVSKQSNVK